MPSSFGLTSSIKAIRIIIIQTNYFVVQGIVINREIKFSSGGLNLLEQTNSTLVTNRSWDYVESE